LILKASTNNSFEVSIMPDRQVYLDHNASAPLLPEARDAMIGAMQVWGNPSSVHARGCAARQRLEAARKAVARLAGAKRNQVVFTGSACEAITQAVVGGVRHFGIERILVSAGEHIAALEAAKISGAETQIIPLSADGVIDVEALKGQLEQAEAANQRVLVAVHMVNNETGVVQPISGIEALLGPGPHLLFVDAVQGLGKLEFDFAASAVDMMAVSAHKIGGPAGVGALLVKSHCDAVRLIPGGGQERGRRGGTEASILIAGFAAAAQAFVIRFDLEHLTALGAGFERQLGQICPQAVIFGLGAERIGSVTNFALPGIKNSLLMMALDLENICVSSGSACSSGKVGQSHVLACMGYADEIAGCSLRVSLGWNTSQDDLDRALEVIQDTYERHQKGGARVAVQADGS